MPDFQAGQWVRRRGGKWHLVESDIADRAIVRCGKQLRHVTPSGGELQVSDVMPLTRMIGQPQLCKAGCDRPGMVVFNNEDDGSTAPDEDTPE